MVQKVRNLPAIQETQIQYLGQEDLWRWEWLPFPIFLPRESHGQRILMGCSPLGHRRVGHDYATNASQSHLPVIDKGPGRGCGRLSPLGVQGFSRGCLTCLVTTGCVLSPSVLSSSSGPRELCLPWLLGPCNSPGKNTGMECHFLLQGIFLTQGLNLSLGSPALTGRFFTTSTIKLRWAERIPASSQSRGL